MIINAEFRETKEVAAAVGELRGQGIGPEHLEIFSSKPIDLEPGLLDRPSHMSLFAVVAALAAGTGVTAFMFYTQRAYPLVTGGMPLQKALPPFTSNAARLLKLTGKGILEPGCCADLVVLNSTCQAESVMTRGEWRIKEGRSVAGFNSENHQPEFTQG